MANSLCEVLLTETELNPPPEARDLGAGAMVDFSGVIRGIENGCEIDGIEYEAHRPMAEHQLKTIGAKAIEKFELQRVIIHHRLGFVPKGKPSLFLRVVSRHRGEAFAAGQWIVDELKKKVPIWKHPRFSMDDKPLRKELMSQR